MIDPSAKLSVSRQAIVLGISRGSVYYQPRPVSVPNLKLMHRIDKLHMEFPFAGTRRVLSWRVSITLEADFCIEAVEEALARYGKPEIFNTDQGSQFTSTEFIKVLASREIKISMDGKARRTLEGAGLLKLAGKHRAGSTHQSFVLMKPNPVPCAGANVETLPSAAPIPMTAKKGGKG